MKHPINKSPPVIVKGKGNIVEVLNEFERVLSTPDWLEAQYPDVKIKPDAQAKQVALSSDEELQPKQFGMASEQVEQTLLAL